ncbi:hypothetical protein HS088_TW13G01273 [Tripterygium wilfordii]|uniref:Uncharacterized protein n=1 Tax=Tripterygium wilfordii TaxID=458696 RepID=A0A7J7CW75_TRIWF|nr:uncharacterized protein LOC120013513 [Tripterygium wilfordii]KAF5738375.1 hypothetical protein HS088_TW13G01273 [Tripterygium wilfordii]
MEPAKIDWKRIESVYVEDKLYENINAPTWVDFIAPEDSIDDEAWFCRPDCNHPKTAEDFLVSTPASKVSSSGKGSKTLPSGYLNQRDAKLKRRGQIFNEDRENQNPNLSTPPIQRAKSMKAAFKSSNEKKKTPINDSLPKEEAPPKLKSTLSARNLFAGRDIINHITEFCNELKQMAMRARGRENAEKLNEKSLVGGKEEGSGEILKELDWKEKERKPLLEVGKEKSEANEKKRNAIEKQKKERGVEAENIPIPLNLENVKNKKEERLLQIRTNPPSPQCFSAKSWPTKSSTPSKTSKSRLMERGILQEVEQNKENTEEELERNRNSPILDGRGGEARALDVFWFLKPCTLSS